MSRNLLLAVLSVFVIYGCGSAGIPKSEYSALSSPEEAYQFVRKSVAKDDPEAFYYCLTPETQKNFSLSELKLGWSLAGRYFSLFLDAELRKPNGIEQPAPEYGNPRTAKITLLAKNMQASFLLIKQEDKWRLAYPSPYSLPDIQKLKTKKRTPWRTIGRIHYQESPEQWYRVSEKFKISQKAHNRLPWRGQEASYYRTIPKQWSRAPKNYEDGEIYERIPYWRMGTVQ